jgi:hypothetical protein
MSETLHGMTTGVSVDGSAVLAVMALPPDAKIGIGASWLMPVLVSIRLVCGLEQEIPRQRGADGGAWITISGDAFGSRLTTIVAGDGSAAVDLG